MTRLALMACLAFLGSSEACAEDWFQVAADERRTIEIDRDSVRRVGTTGFVELRWRTKNSLWLAVSTGSADCARWVLHEDETMVTAHIDKRSFRMVDDSAFNGPHFETFPGWSYGPQLRAACEMAVPGSIQQLTERRGRDCESTADLIVMRQLCERDDLFRANYRLLEDRVFSLEESCGEDQEALFKVLVDVALKAQKCNTDKCATDAVQGAQIFASRDLENIYKWRRKNPTAPPPKGTCRMAEVSLADIARRKADAVATVAFEDYRQCVERSVDKLDDRQSSAEVIARGLHSACTGEFNKAANLSSSFSSVEAKEALYRQFEPKLIEVVLRHRSATKPKKK